MRNKLIWIGLIFLPLLAGGTPDVSFQIQRFRSTSSAFIEVSLYIVGSSLKCDSPSAQYGVEYTLLIRDENDQIAGGNRYRLTNEGCPARDLIDIKRYSLSPGLYTVEIEMRDITDSLNKVSIMQDTRIEPPNANPVISDIQLLSVVKNDAAGESPLTKSGLYMEPLPFNFYYPALETLSMYLETYGADLLEGQPYIRYTIKPQLGEIPAPIVTYKKLKKESIAPNIIQLDIKNLISGPYVLNATLYDGNKNEITAKQVVFSRYNPAGDSAYIATGPQNLNESFVSRIPEDSIDYFIKAIAPVVNSNEVDIMNVLLQKGNYKAKQFFLHRYWTERAGKFAQQAFDAYMRVARVVDDNFRSGFGYGFETDRGHIFLKYGKPDDMIPVEDEPSAPPYEIWIYNEFPTTHQTNVRFLFYNPSLARNAFTLLHSTAIGEVNNERWEKELYRDATLETPGVNEKKMGDNVYRKARQYFEDF